MKLSSESTAKFHVGQIVRHELFDYRGVIFDVDQNFSEDDSWYATMARTQPPKDQPWYRVLVDGATHTTYVAERNLSPDSDGRPIQHPLIDKLFTALEGGRYIRGQTYN